MRTAETKRRRDRETEGWDCLSLRLFLPLRLRRKLDERFHLISNASLQTAPHVLDQRQADLSPRAARSIARSADVVHDPGAAAAALSAHGDERVPGAAVFEGALIEGTDCRDCGVAER